MIAGRLTMRAAVERNQATGKDGWGQPGAADFASTGDPLPCFVWSEQMAELVDGRKTALIGDFRALFALDADLAERDEIASVTDRQGVEIIAGRLRVEGPVERKHTHLEATLKRIG
jgi:hypothetical protein